MFKIRCPYPRFQGLSSTTSLSPALALPLPVQKRRCQCCDVPRAQWPIELRGPGVGCWPRLSVTRMLRITRLSHMWAALNTCCAIDGPVRLVQQCAARGTYTRSLMTVPSASERSPVQDTQRAVPVSEGDLPPEGALILDYI